PKEDEEDPEEDPADYPADGGDNDDNESSEDDDDDDDVEKDEEDEEEEDHLALADPLQMIMSPQAKDIKAVKTDESASTLPMPYHLFAVALPSSLPPPPENIKSLKDNESLSKDILGAIIQRDVGRYYPKRYWEILPKEILGYYPKRYWEILPKEILGDTTQRDISITLLDQNLASIDGLERRCEGLKCMVETPCGVADHMVQKRKMWPILRPRDEIVVLVSSLWVKESGGGVVDLTGDEDPTDEDGDIGVSVSLGVEIFLEGKKSQESNIGDSDNTRDDGKTAGRAIILKVGGIASLISDQRDYSRVSRQKT
ncbi:hypothetical protein Tco_0985855, partial [Tanacetum coccineum]